MDMFHGKSGKICQVFGFNFYHYPYTDISYHLIEALMNSHVFVCFGENFRISTLEFYFYKEVIYYVYIYICVYIPFGGPVKTAG